MHTHIEEGPSPSLSTTDTPVYDTAGRVASNLSKMEGLSVVSVTVSCVSGLNVKLAVYLDCGR